MAKEPEYVTKAEHGFCNFVLLLSIMGSIALMAYVVGEVHDTLFAALDIQKTYSEASLIDI